MLLYENGLAKDIVWLRWPQSVEGCSLIEKFLVFNTSGVFEV